MDELDADRRAVLPDPLTLVILALAVWRLGSLLSREQGPLNVLGGVRSVLFGKLDKPMQDGGQPVTAAGKYWYALLGCPWCWSVQLGIAAAAAWLYWPEETMALALALALSALVIGIDRHI